MLKEYAYKLLLKLACSLKHDERVMKGLKFKTCVRCKSVWQKDFNNNWIKIK